jgi:hypothetical protein
MAPYSCLRRRSPAPATPLPPPLTTLQLLLQLLVSRRLPPREMLRSRRQRRLPRSPLPLPPLSASASPPVAVRVRVDFVPAPAATPLPTPQQLQPPILSALVQASRQRAPL